MENGVLLRSPGPEKHKPSIGPTLPVFVGISLPQSVTFHVLDVSYETPDVTCRISPTMPCFVHVSRETPDVTPSQTSPPQDVRYNPMPT